MKFKFYDILSHLIPGFIVYLFYLEFIGVSFDKDFVVPATAIAFILGYFVNTLASWMEDIYYWSWRGKPSNNLLNGKGIWKVKFYHANKVKHLLQEEVEGTQVSNDVLFSIAMRYATPEANSRVADFNANYAFARVILTTILIATILFISMKPDSVSTYFYTIPLLYVAWYRCKQKGYYYAREVLNTYLKLKK